LSKVTNPTSKPTFPFFTFMDLYIISCDGCKRMDGCGYFTTQLTRSSA
jgi:hypothetical protein